VKIQSRAQAGLGGSGWQGVGFFSGWHKPNAQLATAVSKEYFSILWIC